MQEALLKSGYSSGCYVLTARCIALKGGDLTAAPHRITPVGRLTAATMCQTVAALQPPGGQGRQGRHGAAVQTWCCCASALSVAATCAAQLGFLCILMMHDALPCLSPAFASPCCRRHHCGRVADQRQQLLGYEPRLPPVQPPHALRCVAGGAWQAGFAVCCQQHAAVRLS